MSVEGALCHIKVLFYQSEEYNLKSINVHGGYFINLSKVIVISVKVIWLVK